MMDYQGKDVLLVGMARSGLAAAHMLLRLGARVTVNDMRSRSEFPDGLNELAGYEDICWELGHEPDGLIDGRDLIVFSSGVPFWSEWIKRAREMGIPCVNELEIGFLQTDADCIAITGTNGKTTTTTLIRDILRQGGIRSEAVGNIGVPMTTYALDFHKGDVFSVEAAPFQLVSSPSFRPKVSMILNITEDHLNWFHTMDNYIDGKCLVFANQSPQEHVILNADDAIASALGDRPQARVWYFSRQKQLDRGAFVRAGMIVIKTDTEEITVCRADDVRIPGSHNLENALAAALGSYLMGVGAADIAQTLKDFSGVEHRIETVEAIDGVTYINDSKATNPDAAIKAVQAMVQPTILLLGGSDKQSNYIPLFAAFTPMIQQVIVLGRTAQVIAEHGRQAGFSAIRHADGFDEAVYMARDMASPGMNVLLSPACASYDMFDNYEERGAYFKQIVREMRRG